MQTPGDSVGSPERAGWAPGRVHHVKCPGLGLWLGRRSTSMEHQPGKESKQLGPQPRTPPCSLSLQSPHGAHPQALRAPRVTAGEPAPRGQAGLQGPGGWPPDSRVASSPPPQSPSAQRTDESGVPGTQGSPVYRGAEGNVHRRHAEASRGLEPTELEKQGYPSSTDKEIGSQSLGADQGKSATGHKTGPYSPLL